MPQNDANFDGLAHSGPVSANPAGVRAPDMANIASSLRLTGPAVFVNDPFWLGILQLVGTREFTLDESESIPT